MMSRHIESAGCLTAEHRKLRTYFQSDHWATERPIPENAQFLPGQISVRMTQYGVGESSVPLTQNAVEQRSAPLTHFYD